jgi:hypothetical protein
MTGLLTLTGLGLNVIGSLVLIGSNRELILSIINSFKRIENNMTIDKMGDDEWFPNGWERDFEHIVKKSTGSNRFAFIALTIGFSLQFITTAMNVL